MEKRVTIQGVAGCYHDAAARAYFKDEEIKTIVNEIVLNKYNKL